MRWLFVILVSILHTVVANDLAQQLYSQAVNLQQQHGPKLDKNSIARYSLSVPVDYNKGFMKIDKQLLEKRLPYELLRARELLIESSDLGNVDASYTLAEINLFGNYSYPTNATLALKYFKRVAKSSPNATVYFKLGVIYATGLFGEIQIDQARANLYYQLAFAQGDIRAAMVLGYRYMRGISVTKDCKTALYYYQIVANKLKDIYDASPIGGPNFDSYSVRLGDFNGGLYGEGVGDTYSSLNRLKSRFTDHLSSISLYSEDSLFQESFYKMLLLYEGSYLTPRNYKDAFRYAKHISQQGIKQLSTLTEMDKLYVAQSTTTLGKMFLRGEGVTQDYTEALAYLKKSLDIYKTADTFNILGMIYEFGPDAIKDLSKAEKMYERGNKTANGLYNYGRTLFNKGKEKEGKLMIERAALNLDISAIYMRTNFIENTYSNSCWEQVHMLKYFCEKFDYVVTSLEWALKELSQDRSENALLGYAMAAEQGYETAQASAAYLLFQLPILLEIDPPITTPERRELAITYLTRSSIQENSDSTVFLGDIYFSNKEYDKAVASYLAAGDKGSSQGNFNMGWLYEQGLGVEKDFYLAKRYYDLALIGHSKAYLPVQLALLRLRFKSFFNNITGGKINGMNSHNEQRTWKDLLSMYERVRGTNRELTREGVHRQEEQIEDINRGEEVFDASDLVVIGFFLICFAIFIGVSFLQQRNIRQRRVNGEAFPNPGIEFNFRIIAI